MYLGTVRIVDFRNQNPIETTTSVDNAAKRQKGNSGSALESCFRDISINVSGCYFSCIFFVIIFHRLW